MGEVPKPAPKNTEHNRNHEVRQESKLDAKKKRREENKKNEDLVVPKKSENPFEIDTAQAHEKLRGVKSMEQMIESGLITNYAAHGYFYYGRSDKELWDKKRNIIAKKIDKIDKNLAKLAMQKETAEKSLAKLRRKNGNKNKIKKAEKFLAKIQNQIEQQEKNITFYTAQAAAVETARQNSLKAKSPNYAETNYRDLIRKSLDKWIPKVQGTCFRKFSKYLNDPDLYHALHVQEMMPSRYRDPQNRKIKLTETARVHLYHLFTLYKDPVKMPAINDPVASFGIGQTTLDTYQGLKKLDISTALELPAFEKCTDFDCQMRRDIVNTANNLNHFFNQVVSGHPNLQNLIDQAPERERGIFFAAILGAMHNGGQNCMRKPEKKVGEKLDNVKNLQDAAVLLLANLHRKQVSHYGNHTRGIYASLRPEKVVPKPIAKPKKKSFRNKQGK